MTELERIIGTLDETDAEVVQTLDQRLGVARALLAKHCPDLDAKTPEYASVLLECVYRIDFAIDDDDDDDDDYDED